MEFRHSRAVIASLIALSGAISHGSAFATETVDACLDALRPEHIIFSREFSAGFEAASVPTLRPADLSAVGVSAPNGGWMNAGVVTVMTHDGPAILKAYPVDMTIDRMWTSILIQKHLADQGYAPRVIGVFVADDARALMHSENSGGAILMAKVEQGRLIKGTNARMIAQSIPRLAPGGAARAIHALENIEKILNAVGAKARDFQFLLAQDGTVQVIDLDLYLWKDSTGGVHGFKVPPEYFEGRESMTNSFERFREAIRVAAGGR
jgi:hypothetical protein